MCRAFASQHSTKQLLLSAFPILSLITESPLITEEGFNKLLPGWMEGRFRGKRCLCCFVPCLAELSVCYCAQPRAGMQGVRASSALFQLLCCIVASWRRRVMESRQGWKAWEISAMHRQLQWAQNPRTFTFSN